MKIKLTFPIVMWGELEAVCEVKAITPNTLIAEIAKDTSEGWARAVVERGAYKVEVVG